MQAIQPKVKEIQKKHKWDQAALGMELMKLYKEEQVNPFGSCLPILIQMPILIVMYWVVLSISDSGNYYYLYSFLREFDIAQINVNFYWLNLNTIGGISGGVLAVVVGVAQWIQIKLSLAKDSDIKSLEKKVHIIEKTEDGKYKDADSAFPAMPDPHVMNAFMLWGMPVLLMISTYFFPYGVGIYWLIGTIFAIGQQVVVNKMLPIKKP